MRNLLALFGLLVIGFAGTGWYMGWYKLSVTRSTEGNLEIKADVDTKKVTTDTSTIVKNATTAVGSEVNKVAQDAKTTVPEGAPGGTPGPVAPQSSVFNPLAPAAPTVSTVPAVPPSRPAGGIQLIAPK